LFYEYCNLKELGKNIIIQNNRLDRQMLTYYVPIPYYQLISGHRFDRLSEKYNTDTIPQRDVIRYTAVVIS